MSVQIAPPNPGLASGQAISSSPIVPVLDEQRLARVTRHTSALPFECTLPGRGPKGCSYLVGFDPSKTMLTAMGLIIQDGRLRAFSAAVTSNDRGWTPDAIRARFPALVKAGAISTLVSEALNQVFPPKTAGNSGAFGQMIQIGAKPKQRGAGGAPAWRLPVIGNDGQLVIVGSPNDDSARLPGEFWKPLPIELSTAIRFFGLEGKAPEYATLSAERFRRALEQERAIPGAVPRNEIWDEEAFAEVARIEASRISRLVGAFSKGMDLESLAVISAAPRYNSGAYDFYAEAQDEIRTRRLQAARAFPLLAPAFAHRPVIRKAIDDAQPLNELIGTGFNIGKGGAKRLANCGWRADGLMIEQIADVIGRLPPDWFPRDQKEWTAFLDVAVTAGTVMEEIVGTPVDKLFEGTKGKWAETALKMAQALPRLDRDGGTLPPDTSRDNLVLLCRQVGDVVNAFATEVLKPALAHHFGRAEMVSGHTRDREIRRIAAEILFAGKNMISMIEAAKAWHVYHHLMALEREAAAEAAANAPKDYTEDSWAPLFKPIQAPNGIWIVSLTTTEDLKEEGHPFHASKEKDNPRGLDLCVGGYTNNCKYQGHHILSFRESVEPDPNLKSMGRLSVAQITAVKEGDTVFNVPQHYGYGNSPLKGDDPSFVAMAWLKEMFSLGRLDINFAEIERSREKNVEKAAADVREGRVDALTRVCGFDWRDKGALVNAFRSWSKVRATGSFLPKDLRSREREYDARNPDPLAGDENAGQREEREAFYAKEGGEKLAAMLARPDIQALIDDIMPSYKTVAAPSR